MGSSLHQPVSPVADLLDRLLNRQAIPKATLEQAIADGISRLVGRKVTVDELKKQMPVDGEIDWGEVMARAKGVASDVSSRVSSRGLSEEERARRKQEQEQKKAQEARAREQASHVSRARRILGYSAKEPITKEQVKQRHRELARKHHPDRGGKLERMQDINWAVDILIGNG